MHKKVVFWTFVGLVVVGSLFLYTEWKEEQRRREGIERLLGQMTVKLALANSKIMSIEQALSDPEMHKLFYGPHGVHRPKTLGEVAGQKDRPRTIGEVPQVKEKEKMGFTEKFLLKKEIKREIMDEIELRELMKRGGK